MSRSPTQVSQDWWHALQTVPPPSSWGKVLDGQEGRQEPAERTRGWGQDVQREGEGEDGTAGTEVKGEQEEQGEGHERQELEVMSTVRPGGQPVSDGGRGKEDEEERRMKRSEEIVYLGIHTVRGRAAEAGRENTGSRGREP